MSYPGTGLAKIEAEFKELADDVNRSSASTRNGWLFLLAIHAYLFVILAGLTHRDLLLNTPVSLPLLQVPISLTGFFLFAPLILVLIHMGILLQHVMLARQARELHSRISSIEGSNHFRQHRARFHVHPYSFTQLIAGGHRSPFFAFLLSLLVCVSLGALPIMLLVDFQTAFLPYHDQKITWAHRAYLVADILILIMFAVFMRYPTRAFFVGFGRTLVEKPLTSLLCMVLSAGVMFFSICIATIPQERIDRIMTSFWPAIIPDHREDAGAPRTAFLPTAWLLDGGIDTLSGRSLSPFARNLIVTDADLVRDSAVEKSETSIGLRGRDLRFAIFDRSDLHLADLTGANLTGASLREVNLAEVRASRAVFRGADLRQAQLSPRGEGIAFEKVDLRGADLRGTNLAELDLRDVDLTSALLEGANLQGAQAAPGTASDAAKQGAKF
jgi:hypothetical protein